MTKREIANLCCRVLAVYALLQALEYLPMLPAALAAVTDRGTGDWLSAIAYFLQTIVPLILAAAAWFLWRWSWLIAAWMVGYDIQDTPSEPEFARKAVTATEIHAIAFSVLGLWILIESLPLAIGEVTNSLYMRTLGYGTTNRTSAREAATLIEIMLRVIIGLYLLFGASGLVELLRRLKNVGLEGKDRSKDGGEAA